MALEPNSLIDPDFAAAVAGAARSVKTARTPTANATNTEPLVNAVDESSNTGSDQPRKQNAGKQPGSTKHAAHQAKSGSTPKGAAQQPVFPYGDFDVTG